MKNRTAVQFHYLECTHFNVKPLGTYWQEVMTERCFNGFLYLDSPVPIDDILWLHKLLISLQLILSGR